MDGPYHTEQDATGYPAPGAIACPCLPFEGLLASELTPAQRACREPIARELPASQLDMPDVIRWSSPPVDATSVSGVLYSLPVTVYVCAHQNAPGLSRLKIGTGKTISLGSGMSVESPVTPSNPASRTRPSSWR